MSRLLILLLLLPSILFANHSPPRYRIELNTPPAERWKQIVRDHKDAVPLVVEEAKKYVPEKLQPILFWLAGEVSKLFPSEYREELQGIADASGLPYGEVVGLNILYDITAFDRRNIFQIGCTSIVAEDNSGRIYHGRNLDYEMGTLLKNVTVIVDFTRNGTLVYTGTTFAIYAGLLTGQRPNGYSISLNARYAGAYIDNILMEIYTHFKRPVSFFMREVLEQIPTYKRALYEFSTTSLISPSYIIIGGMKTGEGAIISRDRLKAARVDTLNVAKGIWYLVETNFDNWSEQGDERRSTAMKALDELGQSQLAASTLMQVLLTEPVLNNETIYSGVMSARMPDLVYNTTIVID